MYGKAKPADTGPTWPSSAQLSLGNVTATAGDATWPAASGDVTGYKVYLGAALKATLGADARSFALTGLSAGQTYTVKVVPVGSVEGAGLDQDLHHPGQPRDAGDLDHLPGRPTPTGRRACSPVTASRA